MCARTCDMQNLNCIMGETQSKPTSTHLTIIKHTSIMHETLLECNENEMHENIATISQNPTLQF